MTIITVYLEESDEKGDLDIGPRASRTSIRRIPATFVPSGLNPIAQPVDLYAETPCVGNQLENHVEQGSTTMKFFFVASRLALLVGLVTVLLPQHAVAGGVGAYFGYSRGDQTVELPKVDASFNNDRFEVGVVLDTNVARNELLNVRVSLGYVYTESTAPGPEPDKGHGGAFELGIGAGFWRTPKFRLWAAPIAHIGVDYYENSKAQILDLGFGGGLRIGLNWHVSPRVSVSPSIAYQYLYIRETFTTDDFGKNQDNGSEQLITARFTFLFRDLRDVYRTRPRSRSR